MVGMRDDSVARSVESGGTFGATAGNSNTSYVDIESAPEVRRSLLDDVEALIDDARTYVDAELSYQKTRVSFVSDRLKKAIIFGLGAALLGFVALIGLTVGLIIALTPLLTGWGATAIIVGIELIVVYILLKRASGNWNDIMGAVRDDPDTASSEA